jgi:hypothetical protein
LATPDCMVKPVVGDDATAIAQDRHDEKARIDQR